MIFELKIASHSINGDKRSFVKEGKKAMTEMISGSGGWMDPWQKACGGQVTWPKLLGTNKGYLLWLALDMSSTA